MELFDEADARDTAARWQDWRQAATSYAQRRGLPVTRAGPCVDQRFMAADPLAWPPRWIDRVLGPDQVGRVRHADSWVIPWRLIDPRQASIERWLADALRWPTALALIRDAAALGRLPTDRAAATILRAAEHDRSMCQPDAMALRRCLSDDLRYRALACCLREGHSVPLRNTTPADWCALVATLAGSDIALVADALAAEVPEKVATWLAAGDESMAPLAGDLARALEKASYQREPWSPTLVERLGRLATDRHARVDLVEAARERLGALRPPLTRATRDAIGGAAPAAWADLRLAGIDVDVLVAAIGRDRLATWVPGALTAPNGDRRLAALAMELASAVPVDVAETWAERLAEGDLAVVEALRQWCRTPRPSRVGLRTLARRLHYVLERPTSVGRAADEVLACLHSTAARPMADRSR